MRKSKLKNEKNNGKKIDETLDFKHEEFLNEFYSDEKNLLPELMKKREDLKNDFNDENKTFEQLLDIKNSIREIDLTIKKLKVKRKDYLLNNSHLVFDYFENKKKISSGDNENIRVLDSFFKINNNNENIEKDDKTIEKYFANINPNYLDINRFINKNDICKICKNGELIPIEHEGILVCNNCGNNFRFLVENDKPSYKEPPKEVCFYAYKRINHFREILAQFQAKETTQIPDEIIENIKLQIKKERLDIQTMTNKRTKEVLKKLKYNKYYEHIPFIKDKLGVKPPIMTPELEETLCNLFIDIQAPYAKYCPEDRVNFLNYYYTIYKLCELLNQREFLPYFPMLKDREKRIEQDEIWKNICKELNWKFIPTI